MLTPVIKCPFFINVSISTRVLLYRTDHIRVIFWHVLYLPIWVTQPRLTHVVLYIFYCPHHVRIFIAHVDMLTRVVLYKRLLYTCHGWHMWDRTKVYFSLVHVDTCRTVQNNIFHVATVIRVGLYKKIFGQVSTLIRVVLYKILLYIYPCWHVLYCKKFYRTLVHVDTYLAVQNFFVQVSAWHDALVFTVHRCQIFSFCQIQQFFLYMCLDALFITCCLRTVRFTRHMCWNTY